MSLSPILSPQLSSTRHGFFTRLGGVSTGDFAALNCGYGSPENPGIIRQNRALIARYIGVREDHLLSVTQTHSADVFSISAPEDLTKKPPADAMVTNLPGTALGILTADCAPVLFQDHARHVIGAAHAGWRGAVGGILEASISAMCALGAKRSRIRATVGPAISQRNYEVGQEFIEAFMDTDSRYSAFFIQGKPGKYLFDLPGFVLHQLRAQGIEADWTGHCTYADPARFYSYRYSQHNALPGYGRMLSVIAL